MDELYQHLKIMDYVIICLTNKYRLVHSYVQGVADIFALTVDEYHKLIQKISSLYKESLHNSVHANLVQLRKDVERQRAHDKNLTEIKENLKRAIKLTKTGEVCSAVEDGEKRQIQMDTNLKIDPPYDTAALYRFRHYRNAFLKRYSTITKNGNYLNANEQRKRFLRKLKSSAKVTQGRSDQPDGIFKDEYKNMTRIVSENNIFREAQQLKEALIVNKFLSKAKAIVNDLPQFLCKIIEEFERTESVAQDNMYLFVLLALNKWLKKIVTECERFITYNKTKGYKKKTESAEIHKKLSDYMNDILQRGAEQTMVFSEEKSLFPYPPNVSFNVNTSFLTYFFLYMNKNMFNFVEGYYSTSTGKTPGRQEKKKKKRVKLIKCHSAAKESSLYMSSDVYSYGFRNEREEDAEEEEEGEEAGKTKKREAGKKNASDNNRGERHLSSLTFRINREDMYPNIFLICNYLLLEETKKIVSSIYEIQRGSFDLLLCYDASVIIQLVTRLFASLKELFTTHASSPTSSPTSPLTAPQRAEEEEPYYDDLRKCISQSNLNYLPSDSYVKYVGHMRLMLLNVLKALHAMTKEGERSSVCTFWDRAPVPGGGDQPTTAEQPTTGERPTTGESYTHERDHLIPVKTGCTKKNCYFFREEKRADDPKDRLTHQMEEQTNRAIQRRVLCYDFYKLVADHVKAVKLLIESRCNREEYTGILLKRNNRYNIDGGVGASARSGRSSKGKKSTPVRGRHPVVRKPSQGVARVSGVTGTSGANGVGSALVYLPPTDGKASPQFANKPESKGKASQRGPPRAASKKATQSSVTPAQTAKMTGGLSSARLSSQDVRNKKKPPPKRALAAGKTSAASPKQ
ncbi:conserved Plasmodium protein, unknown function [Plasmodium vivax]|uniref:(malaria parasite P. vivax) hypothetical protein n=1 Tax=Plasmodium vivax TaxID=5855 RepID=A0A1G4HAW0_PLAVI|nr:unnamed protein product [Plasmodium vivax]SCO72031.1 conserved Plasmodium protein, unknown function [Plasmodium vivax]VUZ94899.1 conserved Plasmodium protein, unknown function [Plasmodium vivax]